MNTIKNNFQKALFVLTLVFALNSNAQSVAINTDGSTADPSAILDLKSTNQGVLVPRMTAAQRGLVSSPATGLMVYQTDATAGFYFYNGTAWASISPGVDGFTHYLGEAFNGGIIYYLYKGSDGLEHGLIVALTESINTTWQTANALVGANRTENGAFNTALMTNSPAATYIATLGAGWYLPSIDELGLLYYNRFSVQKALRAGGNTLLSSTANYWSSNEFGPSNAYFLYFFYGYANTLPKSTATHIVRGVRAF